MNVKEVVAAVKARQDDARKNWEALDKGGNTVASLKARVEAIEKLLGLRKEE